MQNIKNNNMEKSEISKLKKELESNIENLLVEFENKCGIFVKGVSYQQYDDLSGKITIDASVQEKDGVIDLLEKAEY